MKLSLSACLILITLFLFSCADPRIKESDKPKYLPKDLNTSISFFENKWSAWQKYQFKSKPESRAVSDAHFSVGMWIRNNWIHGKRDTDLVNYFFELGIRHPDDMSSIILTSLHRKLNNKSINLQQQTEEYKAYWKPIVECHKRVRELAVKNYNRFKVGDPITIFMHVDTSYGRRNAVSYACPTIQWTYNPKQDLTINGIVTEKYSINAADNVFFKVRIVKMNYPDTRILGDTVKSGIDQKFSLDNLHIK